MTDSGNLALVEEFFFALSASEATELELVQVVASVDLKEFAFTESELQKVRQLARRLELSLLTAFTQQFEVASVVVEVRPTE